MTQDEELCKLHRYRDGGPWDCVTATVFGEPFLVMDVPRLPGDCNDLPAQDGIHGSQCEKNPYGPATMPQPVPPAVEVDTVDPSRVCCKSYNGGDYNDCTNTIEEGSSIGNCAQNDIYADEPALAACGQLCFSITECVNFDMVYVGEQPSTASDEWYEGPGTLGTPDELQSFVRNGPHPYVRDPNAEKPDKQPFFTLGHDANEYAGLGPLPKWGVEGPVLENEDGSSSNPLLMLRCRLYNNSHSPERLVQDNGQLSVVECGDSCPWNHCVQRSINVDLAKTDDYETCNEEMGFRKLCNGTANGKCRLCRACASPDVGGQLWWPQGVANCLRCPPWWMNYILVLFAGTMMFLMVYLFLAAALEDSSAEANSAADKQHLSQPMQKIVLNHAQLVSLASGFPLKWPTEIESMFQAMGMFGQAGSYMFNPACNGATVAGDIGGEVVSMFFQKQLVMQMAPFIAIFFSRLFWTCVAIRDKMDPPEERLKRERRRRHIIKKRKQAFERHKAHEKAEHLRLRDRYRQDVKDWKAAKKAAAKAAKNGLPNVKVPPKPDKSEDKYVFKKVEFVFHVKGSKRAKKAAAAAAKKKKKKEESEKTKTKVQPSGPIKIKKQNKKTNQGMTSKKKVAPATPASTDGENSVAAAPENVLHKEYEGTKARGPKPPKKNKNKNKNKNTNTNTNFKKKEEISKGDWEKQGQAPDQSVASSNPFGLNVVEEDPPSPMKNTNETKSADPDAQNSPKNLWKKTSKSYGNNHAVDVFSDYIEHDNKTLLQNASLFTGKRGDDAHNQDSLSDKIKASMRINAQMSKGELGKYDKFVATNVTLMYLCYPVLIKSTFQLVACMPIGKNMYLQMDLNVPCYVGQHLFFTLNLFLPAFICYVVGLPLTGYIIMRRNRSRLYARRMKFRYGTLYTGYTEQCYYWECVM